MLQLGVLAVIRITRAVISVLVEIAICTHYVTRGVEDASANLRRRNRKRVFIFLPREMNAENSRPICDGFEEDQPDGRVGHRANV